MTSQLDRPTRKAPRTAWKPGEAPQPGGYDRVDQEFKQFLTEPFEDQRKHVEQSWLELAYVLPRKALRLALIGTKKESSSINQLVLAAAIAKDKRFPPDDSALSIKIPARLLGSFQGAIVIRSSAQSVIETPDASSD